MHFCFVSMGVEARCPLSKSTAHCRHMKRQPFLCNGCPCRGHRLPLPSPWLSPTPLPLLSPSPLQSPIAVAIVVNHCHCGCCQPLPPPSLLHCRQPSLLPLPLPLAMAISVTIGLCSCHCRRPSPSPRHWPCLRVVALAQQKLCLTN
jgi:hypothetical protein